ncbi:MAG: alpha/beta fold hydrolase [Acidimicrobiales bacterium]
MHRVRSTDGVTVAVHDLGGSGPPLVLAHATGFCAGAWRPVAAHLARRWHCWGVDLRGHGHSDAPAGLDWSWRGFADDLAAVVDALGPAEPVGGVGHSSGATALLLAAAASPSRFRALWCYEPIAWSDPSAARARAEGLAAGALHRRPAFASRAEAEASYRSKPPMSAFHPDALAGYLDCGFEDLPDGTVALRCRPEVEAAVYRQGVAPETFGRLAGVACPVTVARGTASEAVSAEMAAAQVAALPRGTGVELAGLGHFGPFSDPAAVAAGVLTAL